MTTTEDAVMRGFRIVKDLIAEFGTDGAARLLAAADKAVALGAAPNQAAAIQMIRDHYTEEAIRARI